MHFYKKPQIVISVAIMRVQRPKNDCFICVNGLLARLRKMSRHATILPVRQKTNCKTQTTIFAKSTVSGLQVPSPSGTRVAKIPHIACRDSFRKPGPSYPALFFPCAPARIHFRLGLMFGSKAFAHSFSGIVMLGRGGFAALRPLLVA